MAKAPATKAEITKAPATISPNDESPRGQKSQTTKASGIAIFLSTIYSLRIRLEFLTLHCCRLVASFTRDAFLTSSALVLVRYWLVFLKCFPTKDMQTPSFRNGHVDIKDAQCAELASIRSKNIGKKLNLW